MHLFLEWLIVVTWGALIVLGTGKVSAPDKDWRGKSKIGSRLLVKSAENGVGKSMKEKVGGLQVM